MYPSIIFFHYILHLCTHTFKPPTLLAGMSDRGDADCAHL